MSKKRSKEEHEAEVSERWLLTYSDLITLLLALFCILYSMAQVDAQKFNAIAAQFREQIGDAQDAGNAPYMDPPGLLLEDSGGSAEGSNALEQIAKEIEAYIEQNGLQGQITVISSDYHIRIQLRDAMMFVADSPILLEDSKPVLDNINRIINNVYNEVDSIAISGHTADTGYQSLTRDQNSWRLSTERAMTVLNNFVTNGLPQEKLSIQGFAHYAPVADNDTESGRAQNRRVEITIYKE